MGYVEALAADSRAISKRLDNLTERLERIEERLDNDALQFADVDLN
jgi:tetrahydromethanopterin S-methyltransferase subunit G